MPATLGYFINRRTSRMSSGRVTSVWRSADRGPSGNNGREKGGEPRQRVSKRRAIRGNDRLASARLWEFNFPTRRTRRYVDALFSDRYQRAVQRLTATRQHWRSNFMDFVSLCFFSPTCPGNVRQQIVPRTGRIDANSVGNEINFSASPLQTVAFYSRCAPFFQPFTFWIQFFLELWRTETGVQLRWLWFQVR